MSTFSGLNVAHRGLTAARLGIEVVGQNIANVNTEGYTRQRVVTSAVPAAASVGLFTSGARPGDGVSVDGIARLGDGYADARARTTAAASGYWSGRAGALLDLESALREPGENGLSHQLDGFWSAWGDVANDARGLAQGGALLESANALAEHVSSGYRAIVDQWAETRERVDAIVVEVNDSARQVAELNSVIRSITAAGGSPNELIDQRAVLTGRLSAIVGASVRESADGGVQVLVGGNAIVSGDVARPIEARGAYRMSDSAGSPVTIALSDRSGSAALAITGGELGGRLGVLAPADRTGTGGAIAEAAAGYDDFARRLVDAVNTVHRTGATAAGATGQDFFAVADGRSAADSISVLPSTVDEIAAGIPGAGGRDGSVAAAIARLSTGDDAPGRVWASFVTRIGVATRSDSQQAGIAELAATSAATARAAGASVDMDEENINLVTFQTAYQGAARVLTAIDEMLDVLINRTGIVGR